MISSLQKGKKGDQWSDYFEKRKKEEGSVTVMINSDKKKKFFGKDEGEYVKFEEVDN